MLGNFTISSLPTIDLFLKIVIILITLVFIAFTLVLSHRVKTMSAIVNQPSSSLLRFTAVLNIIVAISIFLIAIVIL